ncbi:MAG: protein translocase subunit SecD [Acidimicrobiales bacterium]
MRRKQLTPLVFIVLTTALALAAVLATDTTPQLGLDLQGGVSVVLQPTKDASDEALSQTIEIIRRRVDALGVAEPEIARQGSSVIVQLPGVENQQRAIELVGDTAELRFRPVLLSVPGDIGDLSTSTTVAPPTTVAGDTSTTASTATTVPVETPVEGQSAPGPAVPFQDPTTTTTATPPPTEVPPTTLPAGEPGETPAPPEVTPREEDTPEATVLLQELGDDDEVVNTYQLGPAGATGQIVSTARAELGNDGLWSVALEIKGGDGIDSFNALAGDCFARSATCPTAQLAIVLDSEVRSAPTIQQGSFQRDEIQISGSFSESEAKDLALVLRYGSLPVNLEPQTVQTVSPTLGEESLRAGLIAGLVGLGLVVLYMIAYYRALGVVVLLGLMVWSALNYAIICWLGQTQGLALSLAGVTGLVVSVGVTVDSYVVYFERLKDDVRLGRTLRSSTERSWKRAFRTILAANVASLIGAVLLYVLTVGPVRGFAFFLALATALDVAVAYFFIRPVVSLMGRSPLFTEARGWGVARGLGGRSGAGTPPVATKEVP